MTSHKQTTDGMDYTTAYTHKLNGALDEETYPSTRVVKNVLDTNGDLSMVESRKNSVSGYWGYANSFSYNAAGAVTSMQLGNGLWEKAAFNSRLQPTQIGLGATTGTTGLLQLDYSYGTTQNNGNVQSQTITVPGMTYPLVQNYAYDSLNRIASAIETSNSAQTWKQEFSYDRYGNRNFVTGTGHTDTLGSCTTMCDPSFDTSTNRINSSGFTFDSSGNTTADPSGQVFTYDGENKQVLVTSGSGTVGQYWYDGDGKRIKKYVPATDETTVFVYDATGKEIAEYSSIVANSTGAKVAYLTNDHLGSPRINTDANGAMTARHDYHPFGEEVASSQRVSGLGYAGDSVRKQFTGYERDDETDLDFAQARYYASSNGRFLTVDPARVSAKFGEPQTWNRFVYCKNNPIAYVDENGKWPYFIHNKIIDLAFKGLPRNERDILKKASADVDDVRKGSADPKNAFKHGMSASKDTINIDKKSTGDWITGNVLGARILESIHDHERALYQFGLALHTVTDMTSPTHEGYQVWHSLGETWYGLPSGLVGGGLHIAAESVGFDWRRQGLAIGAAHEIYRYTFGDEALRKATNGVKYGEGDDPSFREIDSACMGSYGMVGSGACEEWKHQYRLGLEEGSNIQWHGKEAQEVAPLKNE